MKSFPSLSWAGAWLAGYAAKEFAAQNGKKGSWQSNGRKCPFL